MCQLSDLVCTTYTQDVQCNCFVFVSLQVPFQYGAESSTFQEVGCYICRFMFQLE